MPNIIVATPVSPLPVGDGWEVSVLKGLPNLSANARLTENSGYKIGKIEPFKIADIKPQVVADKPRQIIIHLNQPAPEKLPADFLETCSEIAPRPENLQAEADGREIQLSGDLSENDTYSITLKPPFTSKGGLGLAEALTKKITFEHLAPHIAFLSLPRASSR